MTGWQPGDGGWNQNQAFGPDAQTNAYGTDPYANQGADPYGYGSQYGNDPTPYGADPYQYGQYQQQYPPTSGFPAQGYGPPPPPPKRSKLPIVLSLVAIVIIVGAVVTIVLVNRQGNEPVTQNDPNSTSARPDPSESESPAPTSASTTPSGGGSDWVTIDNTKNAELSYQVPPDWKPTDTAYDSGLGVNFTGGAEYGNYECEGNPYLRTYLASGDVKGEEGRDLELTKTLQDFADSFAKKGYGEDAQVDVPAPTETEVDGKPAMTVTAKVKQNVTVPNCQVADAEVTVLGLAVQEEGQPKGVAMLVVVNDLPGGPAEPKALDPSVVRQIFATVKVG